MEEILEAVRSLEVGDQRRLLVELLASHLPDTQLSLLIPALSAAPGYVKWRASCLLEGHITPDLVSLLPPELQLAVLSYVDGPSLLDACSVSHTWHSLIRSHQQLWVEKCCQLGINLSPAPPWPPLPSPSDWQKVYVGVARQAAALRCGRAFTQRWVHLHNCNTPVKAVDYRGGYLCTVSEADQVTIWHLGLNVEVLTFPCQRTVSCLCLHPASLLVCGHFTGILTSWDLSAMPRPCPASASSSSNHKAPPCSKPYQPEPGVLINKFKMHAGPVFSCDFSEELDIMVSGSADECLKLWSLSSGLILYSLATRDHWVLRVTLLPAPPCPAPSSSFSHPTKPARHRVIYMTRQRVAKISWPAACKQDSKDMRAEGGTCESENDHHLRHKKRNTANGNFAMFSGCATHKTTSDNNSENSTAGQGKVTCDGSVRSSSSATGDTDNASRSKSNTTAETGNSNDGETDPLKNSRGNIDEISEDGGIDLKYGGNVIFTPGLQTSSKYIALVQQDLDEKSARLFLFDIDNLAPVRSLALGFKVKKLLAVGDRYTLLLTPGSVLYSSTLTVLDVVTGAEAGTSTVPHSKMTTPDGAQIVVGETGWLNGLGPHLPQPPLSPAPGQKSKTKVCSSCRCDCPLDDCDTPDTMRALSNLNQGGEWVVSSGPVYPRPPMVSRPSVSPCVGTSSDGNISRAIHSQVPPNSSLGLFSAQRQSPSQGGNTTNHQMDLKLEQPGHLVLAAGVQSEPGRLFTLWWAQSGREEKHKKE